MASKSKRRGRVFRASCILAALIIAGSSFAWFTSKDEVTNRLSASADYGVSIVESFAPPKNWIPGQEVNKDTYAVNTGSVAAYVRNDVSGVLTITKEAPVAVRWGVVGSTTNPSGIATALVDPSDPTNQAKDTAFGANNKTGKNFDSFITLDEDEVFSIEAGSYLAYKPAASQQELGKQVVLYPSNADSGEVLYRCNAAGTYNSVAYTLGQVIDATTFSGLAEEEKTKFDKVVAKTDFTPDKEGLYVFRRSVIVNNNATEQFEYNCYYFKDGRYYKMTDLVVTQDDSVAPNLDKELDVAGDGNDMDGQLANAEAKFLIDETKVYYEPDKYEYDDENNRLVATYFTHDDADKAAYQDAAKALDRAEHELAQTRTALDKALMDKAASDEQIAFYMNRIAQLNNEIKAVKDRIAALVGSGASDTPIAPANNTILKALNDEKTTLTAKKDAALLAANNSLNSLYGVDNSNKNVGTIAESANVTSADFGKIKYNNTDTIPDTIAGVNAAEATTSNGLLKQYLNAKKAVDDKYNDADYGHDLFTAYVNELEAIYDTDLGTNETYETILNKLSYIQLSNVTNVGAGTSPGDQNTTSKLHNIHELMVNAALAKEAYETELSNYNSQIKELKTAIQRLGSAGTTTPNADNDNTTDIVGGTDIAYTTYSVTGQSGAEGDIAVATAEYNTLKDKLDALQNAYDQAVADAVDAEKVGGTGADASDTATTAWTNYQEKSLAYDQALATFEAAKKKYEDNRELKIYINLSDKVVTEAAGLPDRWQIWDGNSTDVGIQLNNAFEADGTQLKTPTTNTKLDTAVFYYTGILEPSETSSQLIDSVTLDSGVNQNMYKYFDYDLNVALKSAQIAYTGNGDETISTVPADTELGNQFSAAASLTNNKSLDTAVNWKTATP